MGIVQNALGFIAPQTTKLVGDGARLIGDVWNAKDLSDEEKKKKSQELMKRTVDLKGQTDRAKLEAGSMLLPAAKGLGALASGAVRGVTSTLANTKADNPMQFIKEAGTSGVVSGIAEAAIPGAGNIARKYLPKGKIAKDAIAKKATEASEKFGQAMGEAPEQIAEQASKVGDKVANSTPIKLWLSNFTIPTKRAKSLRPQETAQEMIEDGITGSMEQMKEKVEQVTNMTSRITNAVANKIQAPILLDDVRPTIEKTLKGSLELTKDDKDQIISVIENAREGVNGMGGADALEHVRELEKLGHQYLNTSTYLTGNIRNEQIGNAFIAAAKEVEKRIIDQAESEGIVNDLITPDVIQMFNQISPRLAQKVMNAKTLREIRAIAAPYVRTDIMLDLTDQSSQSTFNKFANNLEQKISGGISLDPVKTASSLVTSAAESPAVRTGTAKFMNGIGGLSEGVGNAIDAVGNAVSQPIQAGKQMFINNMLGGSGMQELPDANASSNEQANNEQQNPNPDQMINHTDNIPQNDGSVNDGSVNKDVVKIRNKKTGEVREVPREQLGEFGVQDPTKQARGSKGITGFDQEELGQAYARAVMAGDKSAATQIKQLYDMETAYQKENKPAKKDNLTAGQLKEMSDIEISITQMQTASDLVDTYEPLMGPTQGKLRGINKYDEKAQTFQSGIEAIAQQVGKAMEGGVLRAEDVPKYKKMLPQIDDLPAVARNKIKQVEAMLQNNYKIKDQLYNEYKAAGGSDESSALGFIE